MNYEITANDPSALREWHKSFELGKTPEGAEIEQKYRAEFQRRLSIFGQAMTECGILRDRVAVLPPVLSRSDLGYFSDLDVLLFGVSEEDPDSLKKSMEETGVYIFFRTFTEDELDELSSKYPEAEKYLRSKTGGATEYNVPEAVEDFENEREDLEARSRGLLSHPQKVELQSIRKAIADRFVTELNERFPVLAIHLSGSTFEDLDKFGFSSDLDIDFLMKDSDDFANISALIYAADYLVPKYAEIYQVKVDVFMTDMTQAREMCSYNPDFIKHYQKQFGVEIKLSEDKQDLA